MSLNSVEIRHINWWRSSSAVIKTSWQTTAKRCKATFHAFQELFVFSFQELVQKEKTKQKYSHSLVLARSWKWAQSDPSGSPVCRSETPRRLLCPARVLASHLQTGRETSQCVTIDLTTWNSSPESKTY